MWQTPAVSSGLIRIEPKEKEKEAKISKGANHLLSSLPARSHPPGFCIPQFPRNLIDPFLSGKAILDLPIPQKEKKNKAGVKNEATASPQKISRAPRRLLGGMEKRNSMPDLLDTAARIKEESSEPKIEACLKGCPFKQNEIKKLLKMAKKLSHHLKTSKQFEVLDVNSKNYAARSQTLQKCLAKQLNFEDYFSFKTEYERTLFYAKKDKLIRALKAPKANVAKTCQIAQHLFHYLIKIPYPSMRLIRVNKIPCVLEAYSPEEIFFHFSGILMPKAYEAKLKNRHFERRESGGYKDIYYIWQLLPFPKRLTLSVSKRSGPRIHEKRTCVDRSVPIFDRTLNVSKTQKSEQKITYEQIAMQNVARAIRRLYGYLKNQPPLNPYIIRVYKLVNWDNGQQTAIMDHCKKSLYTIIDERMRGKKECLTDQEKIDYALGIARGIDYMHRLALVHGDIKVDNILIKRKKPVLIDFDFTVDKTLFRADRIYGAGTKAYTPYELLEHRPSNDYDLDIWALGCVFWQLFATNIFPWYEDLVSEKDKTASAKQKIIEFHNKRYQDPAINLVWELLQPDPDKRPRLPLIVKKLEALKDYYGQEKSRTIQGSFDDL